MLILQIHCYFLLEKYTVIFCWKNVRIFCNAKDSHIFPTKNNSVFENVVGIYLNAKDSYIFQPKITVYLKM